MRGSTTTARAFALAGFMGAIAACAGETDQSPATTPPADAGNGIDSGGGKPGTGPDDTPDAAVDPGGGADGGPKVPKPKAIGSPCTADADCAPTLSCDPAFTGGMCTKTCAADTDCAGKGGAVGACVDTKCFASCTVDADAGATDEDAGKTKGPCKNKTFACVAVPGRVDPACLPGADDGGTDSGVVPADAAASD
jgi:hypothetical protein